MDGNRATKLAMVLLCGCLLCAGCRSVAPRPVHTNAPLWIPPDAPRELDKVILPIYTIEPPDVLSIDAINIVPRSPYYLKTGDRIELYVEGVFPEQPIGRKVPIGDAEPYAEQTIYEQYMIESGGIVHLGPRYGSVRIAGKTVEDARLAIEKHLQTRSVANPKATLFLRETVGKQQIIDEHLVGPDGTVTLGSYGSVSVVGKTVAEAKAAIEAHLSQFLEAPEVSVVVFAFNSKVYYVITQGAGLGDAVVRFPVMGNETVMDAISGINGLTAASSARIWIARPGKNAAGCDQILPVDWLGITQRGDVATNYQLLPGDRVYVAEDKWIAFDQAVSKFTSPLERIMGFTLLGTGTVTRLSGNVLKGGGNPNTARGF